MPEVKATHRYLRTSPYKVREVLDLVRGLPVEEARQVLTFHARGSAREVLKLLNSAIANAEHNNHLPGEELYVSKAFADEGITLKRWRPRARGRATRIRKRTSHVTVIVDRMSSGMLDAQRARDEHKTSSRSSRVAASKKVDDKQSKRAKKEIAEVEQELANASVEPADADAGDGAKADTSPQAGTPSTSAASSTDSAESAADEPTVAEETPEDEAVSDGDGDGDVAETKDEK